MSCMLRVSGNFDPDLFLIDSRWDAETIYRCGEAYVLRKVAENSGFTVVVSDATFDEIQEQIQDALQFLRAYGDELGRLKAVPQTAASLDFGLARREKNLACFVSFPPELIELAGRLGLGVDVSLYAISEESGDGDEGSQEVVG